jgi:hypothetical protein
MNTANFVSDLARQLPVVSDDNWRDHVKPPASGGEEFSQTGYQPRDWHVQPLGSAPGSAEFPQHMLWPKETWKERIKELEAKKARISDVLRRACARAENKFICLNQNPTNYCWCYAVIHAIMAAREVAGEPFVRLSPFSVACLVKNYQNIGGWGSQALARIVQEGVAAEEFWPMERPGMSSGERSSANMNAIRNGRQYLAGSRANAALHKVLEFWDLRPRSWEEMISCLLHPLPVASGRNWMGHERCSLDAVVLENGDTGCVDLDSYTSDGGLDLKILSSSRGAADDAVVPRVVTASNE